MKFTPKAIFTRLCLLMAHFLMIGFLTQCKSQQKSSSDTLIIGIENEIKNLDLRFASDANSTHVSKLVFQSLVSIGEDLRPVSDLAESFSVQDEKIFTFKIPQGIRFHDGTPLTSKDVLYNFRQASGPKSKIKSSFDDVERFEAPDNMTFVIRLKKPRPSFLTGEVSSIRIFPEHLGESPTVAEHPVGSGPYRFVRRKHRDLIFERFEHYKSFENLTHSTLPRYKHLIVRSIEDPTTRYLSLVGGDIDILINSLAARRVQEALSRDNLQVIRSPGSSYQYIGLHQKNEKFKDPRVRKALTLAIHRKEIIEHKLKGYAQPANSVLSPQNYFANPKIEELEYNPTLAEKLLKEAGVKNLEIEIRSSSDRDMISILQIIQQQWKKIGVEAKLRSSEFASFFAEVQKGNFEAFSLRWTSVTDPDLLNRIFHSRETPPGRNRIHYKNTQVDSLLDKASSETDLKKRQNLYFEVQEILANDFPYISLWYPDNIAVASRRLKDIKLGPTGSWMGLLNSYKVDLP